MPRFLLSNQDGAIGLISGDEARHVLKVHRHKLGDVLEVTGSGRVYRARVTGISGDIDLELIEELESPEPDLAVTLYQGLVKADKLELIIQKAVELGVSRIVPVECVRSIVTLEAKKARERTERWQRIAQEAAKQSGRAAVPVVDAPQPLSSALQADRSELKLMAYEGGGLALKSVLGGARGVKSVSGLIGPEGGVAPQEVIEARAQGFVPITLGPRILRAETAPLSLLSIVMYELSDLGGINADSGISHPRVQG